MTDEQLQKLLKRWEQYDPDEKLEIFNKYLAANDRLFCLESFFEYFKFKLDIENYFEKLNEHKVRSH